ncbi:MAG: SPOR domain-containing protein, partial [Bacteroidales bacterium]
AENNVEAAIPSLGVFYLENKDSSPVHTILFKEKLPKSKVFLNFVAFEENLTEQEALDAIETWVKGILKELKASGLVNIPNLGTFEIVEGKVEFYPSPDQFTADDVFGLENQETDNKEEEIEKKKVTNSQVPSIKMSKKTKRHIVLYIAIVLIAILVVWLLLPYINTFISKASSPKAPVEINLGEPQADPTFLSGENDSNEPTMDTKAEDEVIAQAVIEGEKNKRIQNSVPTQKKSVSEVQNTQTRKVESSHPAAVNKTPANKVQASKTTPSALRYYIIADAFAVKENADKRKRELNDKAYTVEILHDAQKNLYMVSVKSFSDMDKALDFKAIVRDQKGIPCWIYKK